MAWLHSGHRFGCYIPLAGLVVNQNVVKVGNEVEMQRIRSDFTEFKWFSVQGGSRM